MIANNVILIFLLVNFNLKPIRSQIRNNQYGKKNVIDLYEGSGNEHGNETNYMKIRPLTSDDEDSGRLANLKTLQSSGDGPPEPPNVYPSLDPYTKSRSTATILVDFAIEEELKSYMLPGANGKYKLRAFHNEIIKNLKGELKSLNLDLGFNIISLRPGPLIPKKTHLKGKESGSPSVFARVNITQHNSSIVNPLILFHISQCARLGTLGNLTISDQIIFPQYVCQPDQVYCLPDCKKGAYCDGIQDCPKTDLDESPSCPKCIYKNLRIKANNEFLNEGENLFLRCEFKESCKHLENKIRWRFPPKLKIYENLFKGQRTINSLPRNEITSGSFKCLLDGDSVVKNITVFEKPQVLITNTDPNAELILMTELEGSDIDIWCNATNGYARWMPIDPYIGKVSQPDRIHSKISLQKIMNTITLQCQVRWGYDERGHILKTVTINVVCDLNKQFKCTDKSIKMCIPIEQKCDSIIQCEDGSDENDCNYCKDNSITVDVGQKVIRDIGDTLIMTCSSTQESCNPLSWSRYNSPLISRDNFVVYKFSVFILNISSEHAGKYQCSGPSNKGHYDVSLIVNEPPILKINPPVKVLNITYGQSQDIECLILESSSSNNQNLSPVWKIKDNKVLHDNSKIINLSNRKAVLRLNRVTEIMEGTYQCEVTWGLGANRQTSEALKVNVVPLNCRDGERICANKMMCISKSMWCDGQKHCQDGSDEEMCSKCRRGFIMVQPENIVILSKESAQATCYYDKDCYPVEWRVAFNKVPIQSISSVSVRDNKLLFNNVSPETSNIYECFSGDQSSKVNVTVINEIQITFFDNPGYLFIDHGKDIEIDCQTNYGEPIWISQNFKNIEDIAGAKQVHIQPNRVRLIIKSISYDARGYYNCSVRLPGSNKQIAMKFTYIHVYDLECPKNYLKCDKKTKCIPEHKICNDFFDCNDKQDEKNCSKCKYDLEVIPKSLVLSTFGWGSLQCKVPNADCRPIRWEMKSGKPLKPTNFFRYNDNLFIFNSTPLENEEVVCTNGLRSASSFLTVKRLELSIFPNQTLDSTIYINKGGTQNIECRSTMGTPHWIFPNEDTIASLGLQYLTRENDVAIIRAEHVKENASGIYTCSVTFSKEVKKKTISIKVF